MTSRSKIFAAVAIAVLSASLGAQQAPPPNRLVDSMQKKLDYLRENGAKSKPDSKPTVLTEDEINAYMASGRIKVPAGITNIHAVISSGLATATGRVDFDELLKNQRSANPLWTLFSGTHDVRGLVQAAGHGGTATLHVQEVDFDGHAVPRIALEFFVDHFLKPRVPAAGLDSSFKMPARIDSATLGSHKLTLVQK